MAAEKGTATMTHRTPGAAPEHMYEPSFCNQALESAGLDIVPPQTLSSLSRRWHTPDSPRWPGFTGKNMVPLSDITSRASRRLRQLRIEARLTVREVAAATDINPQLLTQYELGTINVMNASFDRIAALARFYGVNPSDILNTEQAAD